jgi:predicted ATPase
VSLYGGYDPGVACQSWLGWAQYLRGIPDQSLRSVEEALALAERLGHLFTLNFAHISVATVRLFRGETQAALGHLERAAAISNAEGFAYHRAVGATVEGWALVTLGRPEDAIARLREGLAGYEATGAAVTRPSVLALLAYALAMTGRMDEGLEQVAQGLDEAERTHQRLHLVQLNLTRGDLLLLGGRPKADAELCYRRALDLAHGFGTTMLELRAATRLARVLTTDGRTDELRALLAPLVGAFREGLDLRDLRDARALLSA